MIQNIPNLKELQQEITRFLLQYRFALKEIETKVEILQAEFELIHEYNPIEHVTSRIKSPQSIINKMIKKGCTSSLTDIKENIRDIAGVRIICSFTEDIYKIGDMLKNQKDVEVVQIKDYIKNPKANGYRSLHLIVKIPIFMSDRMEHVYVEIQIRTIAMDFWASLEHKIYYKYNKEIPKHIQDSLRDAAQQAAELDKKMED
ncbi:GTP pyrophosphokinase YwaC [Caldibacillus thermoamylovorans]|uniref:GTP pyrophosphokinase YwaC n=2 Tax=Caldibacillus thermoamylovorans TaxID=35841 RepID=A0A090ISR6_9BACI|nr:GTP pyrophosphokinase family protein [Caldibacillus thermoamylovorans]CEE00722.1 GTP pyrophosphokinase YwaC [Caldibacillus thermoamylovorans]